MAGTAIGVIATIGKLKHWPAGLLPGIFLLAACQAPASLPTDSAAPTCQETGTVASGSFELASSDETFSVSIYLPPCYESSIANYPVVYLLPGAGGNQETWLEAGADEAADAVIRNGDVPPFVIVFTDDTGLDPNPDYIVTDLIPHIESQYRIRADRAHRSIGGGSLGGMTAYRLGLRFPDQFASLGIFGSGVVKGDEAQMKAWLTALPPENRPRVFLNCGLQDTYMLERTRVTVSILDEIGIESELIIGEGGHDRRYWVSNFPAYFEWASQDW